MAVVADNLLGSVPAYRLVLHAFVVIIYCSVGVFKVMLKLNNIIIEHLMFLFLFRLSFFVDFWFLVCRFL